MILKSVSKSVLRETGSFWASIFCFRLQMYQVRGCHILSCLCSINIMFGNSFLYWRCTMKNCRWDSVLGQIGQLHMAFNLSEMSFFTFVYTLEPSVLFCFFWTHIFQKIASVKKVKKWKCNIYSKENISFTFDLS